jgi:hypothetical protein
MTHASQGRLEMAYLLHLALRTRVLRAYLPPWLDAGMVEGALVLGSDSFRYVQLPPVHARTAFSAKFSNVDPEIQRFVLMWKLYTRARKARQLPLATSREEGSILAN